VKDKIRASAERDLDEAASWYRENATDPRTPLRFPLEVRATFELIAESPGVFAEIHGGIPRSTPAFGLEAAPVTNQWRGLKRGGE
jgi:plasmid stabilization system protein ParE